MHWLLCNVKIQSCGKNRIYSISGWKYLPCIVLQHLDDGGMNGTFPEVLLFAVAKFNPTVFRSLCAIVLFLRFHYLCSGPTVKSFKTVLKWQKSRYVSTLVQCFDDFPSRVKKFEINLSFIPAIVKLHWKNLSRDTPSYKRKDAAPLNTYRLY